MSTLLLILIIILVIAAFGGAFGMRSYGWPSFSPVVVILLVLLILYLAGYL